MLGVRVLSPSTSPLILRRCRGPKDSVCESHITFEVHRDTNDFIYIGEVKV